MPLVGLIDLALSYWFVAGTFIIAGIDKENFEIPNGLILYELIVGIIYTIFLYATGEKILSNIIGFVAIPLILFIVDYILKKLLKDESKLPFGMGDIKYMAVIGLFVGFGAEILTIVIALLITGIVLAIQCGIRKIHMEQIPFGFYLSIAANIVLIAMPLIKNIIDCIEMIIL